MEANRLSNDDLERYAQIASDLRVAFTQKSAAMLSAQAIESGQVKPEDVEEPRRIHRGCKKMKPLIDQQYKLMGFEAREEHNRRKRFKKSQLKVEQLSEIVSMIKQGGLMHYQIANFANVKPRLIGDIAKSLSKDSSYLDDLAQKEDMKLSKNIAIMSEIQHKINEDCHIWKADSIQKLVHGNQDVLVSLADVRKVMK